MNLHTCVVKEIAQLAGEDVQDSQIIVAFQNGCSVMEKMIVEIIAMSCQKIVQHANKSLTINVKIIAAYRSNGLGKLIFFWRISLYNFKKF